MHHLGQKYKVQPLIEQCEALLGEEIPVENAVEMYETAVKYGILDVKQKALDLIVRYWAVLLHILQVMYEIIYNHVRSSHDTKLISFRSLGQLLQDPQLLAAKEATLMEMLKRNDLRVKEVDLFRFVVRYAIQFYGTWESFVFTIKFENAGGG